MSLKDKTVRNSDILDTGVKKRGRKPKGGKIIKQQQIQEVDKVVKPNIILHLKCSLKDLNNIGDYNSNFTNSSIDPYNFDSNKSEYKLDDFAESLVKRNDKMNEQSIILRKSENLNSPKREYIMESDDSNSIDNKIWK